MRDPALVECWLVRRRHQGGQPRQTPQDGWQNVINFYIHYLIDDNLSSHEVLSLDMYGGDEVGSWVLLELDGVIA